MDRGERKYGRSIVEQLAPVPPLPPLPILNADQLRALDARWPEYSPQLHDSHDVLMWLGGARSVVRMLIQAYEKANE